MLVEGSCPVVSRCRRPLFSTLFLLVVITSHVEATFTRQELVLNGEWSFKVDARDEGEKEGYFRPTYDASTWSPVSIPAGFGTVTGDVWFEGTIWFRRSFRVSPEFAAERTVLRFEGVNNHAQVWLNGKPLGTNAVPYLPWEVPLGNLLSSKEENTLVARVDNLPVKTRVPWPGGWHHDGGILRDVRLIATSPVYIDDARVIARPTANGDCQVEAWLSYEGQPPGMPTSMQVGIFDESGDRVARARSDAIEILAGDPSRVAVHLSVPNATSWSPDTPVLYRAELSLLIEEQPVDGMTVRFGFRDITVRGEKLLLNGNPLYLVGFNRHEDSPRSGMASDPEQVRADLSSIKQPGGNFVRFQYPHDPIEMDMCDELGLLVMAEAPISHWDGISQEHLVAAKHYVQALIRRDKNHPSVIFWSVGNESNEEKREVVRRNDDLIKLAKQLDATRLVVHVSERGRWARPDTSLSKLLQLPTTVAEMLSEPGKHPLFEYDDVVCVNGYPFALGRFWARNADYSVDQAAEYWRKALADLYARYRKPILITEFGYPTGASLRPAFDGELGELMQAKAIAAEFEAFQEPYVCGATVWCFADHLWPRGRYQADVSPYGVVYRDRKPKPAWSVIQRLFSKVAK